MEGEEQEGGSIDRWMDGRGRREKEGRKQRDKGRKRRIQGQGERDRERGAGEETTSTNVRPLIHKGGFNHVRRQCLLSGVRRQRFPSKARRASVMAQGRGHPQASSRVLLTEPSQRRLGSGDPSAVPELPSLPNVLPPEKIVRRVSVTFRTLLNQDLFSLTTREERVL